jgi:hypothetical protein
MKATDDTGDVRWAPTYQLDSPFAEAFSQSSTAEPTAIGFAQWSEATTPFAEATQAYENETENDRLLSEAFDQFHDEEFNEAVAFLAEETEQSVSERFTGEASNYGPERERFAEAQLSGVRYEAEQYLGALETGLANLDVASLTPDQLDETMERFTPQPGDLSPAGEEFIGKLIKKAKKIVKFVANPAKLLGKLAGPMIAPLLKKLKALINPLLQRVLRFAIGKLPEPLRPAARKLAEKLTARVAGTVNRATGGATASAEPASDDAPMSPATTTDTDAVVDSVDAQLAEALIYEGNEAFEGEAFSGDYGESSNEGSELHFLSEARGQLIDRLGAASDQEALAPVVEQFIPAILSALRLGVKLIGRPKVVSFLARYLAQLIGKWVGPELKTPLSNAIVNAGLRLISLEAESSGQGRADETGPVAIASVIEDTVRRLAESEDYVFENEDLMQLAASEAFSQAVAAYFPPQFVREDLQEAPSLGGAFVTQRPRNVRSYSKFNRTPTVEVTSQMANALPGFGGSSVGAAMRAAGAKFPVQARMHVYKAKAGTTAATAIRHGQGGGRSSGPLPLTPAAAGLLLREPRLGAHVPAGFMRTPRRIAVGQRFYVLEPLGPSSGFDHSQNRAASARMMPGRAWISVNRPRAQITIGIYLSEAEAQRIVEVIRQGRGNSALLQALVTTFKEAANSSGGPPTISREEGEEFEEFAAQAAGQMTQAFKALLRKRIAAWALPALAEWARNNGEAFMRAVAHPDAGVTVRIHLTAVPGLNLLGQAGGGTQAGSATTNPLAALRGTPSISVTVSPGRRRS